MALTPQIALIILLSMMFCNIVSNFYVQGSLTQIKQKSWWEDICSVEPRFQNDYKAALIIQSFLWCFFIHIPLILHIRYCHWTYNEKIFLIVFVADWIIHTIIDDFKCNKHKLNLVFSQSLYLMQVIITWILYFWEVG